MIGLFLNRDLATYYIKTWRDPIAEGFQAHRVKFSHCEKGFAEQWKKTFHWLDEIIGRKATPDDYWVAASLFQWLGTNVGFSVLTQALLFSGSWIHTEPYPKPIPDFQEDPLLKSMAQTLADVEWEARRCKASRYAAQMLFDLSEAN